MSGVSFAIIQNVLRIINLCWYLLLTPVFFAYLLLLGSGLKQQILIGYDYIADWFTIHAHLKTKSTADSVKPIVDDKHSLEYVAAIGGFPVTVCLALFYVPFYFYSMVWWSAQDFLVWNIPLMFFYALICCDDTHYDSHDWVTKRRQSVWYRRLFSGRFRQYTQMIWYPLTQHLPHLHIHHKFSMKNQQDIDYIGWYQRDGIRDFFTFLSTYEWNYNWNSLRYFYNISASHVLLRIYIKDVILNYGLLVFAAYCGWEKFVFQYACNCLCYYFLAWLTFYVEHPFHHVIDGSYEHYWNALTVVNSTNGLCSESHTSHHIWPTRSMEENAAWANDPVEFANSQLKYRHIAIGCSDTYQEMLYMPYLMITKQYSRLAQMLHFKDSDYLKAAGMNSQLIHAYELFQSQCDAAEIKCRLQAH